MNKVQRVQPVLRVHKVQQDLPVQLAPVVIPVRQVQPVRQDPLEQQEKPDRQDLQVELVKLDLPV